MPYLYGGYGGLGETGFFASYNLPEVGIYLGILPVIALLVLWIPSWPSRLVPRERLTWYLIALLGVLLALGGSTPLEHLFNEVPLYGHQRLQSRNMIDLSVALCVLFAGWIDRRRESPERWVAVDRWSALIPLAVVLGLLGWAIVDPGGLIMHLTGVQPSSSLVATVREATIVAAGFCLVASIVVWLRPILSGRHWIPLVSAFVLVDLGLMVGTSQLSIIPPNDLLSGTTSIERYIGANLAPGGRFAVYDPQGYTLVSNATNGIPDYNILAGLPSVAGYSSIVNGNYEQTTNTHTVGELNTAELKSGAFDDLDLQDILTTPEYFMLPLGAEPTTLEGVQPVSEGKGQDADLPLGSRAAFQDAGYTFYPAPREALRAGQVSAWFFGESLTPTRASLVFSAGAGSSTLRFGTFGATGATSWGPSVTTTPGARTVTGALPPRPASGLAVQVVSGHIPSHQAVITADGHVYELDGSLSDAIRPGTWQERGSMEGQSLFVRTAPPEPLRAITRRGQPAPPIDVISRSANAETIRLQAATPLALVRDVAWDSGWAASVSANGRAARSVAVSAYGPVQQVRLPAGRDVVTFRYRPAHFVVASVLSGAAVLFLLVLAGVAAIRVRCRRRSSTAG